MQWTRVIQRTIAGMAAGAMVAQSLVPVAAAAAKDKSTTSPIQHVIIIIGENRTFDHVFATYQPVNKGEFVDNLFSKQIVNADGTPGPNYGEALQYNAINTSTYQLTPPKTPYATLPPVQAGGPSTPFVCQFIGVTSGTSCNSEANVAAVINAGFENGLPSDYIQYLLTGGTGQKSGIPDARIRYDGSDASNLPPGPYQLTSETLPYDSYTASPVHRFFQMWQQLDCDSAASAIENGWGCDSDLFPWVEATVGAGSNGAAPAANFIGEGSTSMGFYNVQEGDAPYLKYLADNYSMSDNYHQAVNGGTGANHVALGTGDAVYFSDASGNPATPPENPVDPNNPGTPPNGMSALQQIENPNPMPGTNNFYTQDGYGGGSGSPTAAAPSANYGGGSYVDCSDSTQPGVTPILDYLSSLVRPVKPNCESGHYYLLNNYNPGYFGDGTNAFADTNANNTVFTVPPSSRRTIGDELDEQGVSWAYYGDQFDKYVQDKYFQQTGNEYCNICNWAQYSTSIMTHEAVRTAHLKDTTDLYAAIANGTLPAVSYVKPSGLVDGHPASSKLNLYEGFVKKIVDAVQSNKKLWASTAIFVTFDEGGGYYDSGYVQPLDFFGDGTRVPMIVVSPYTKGGHIDHTYTDHVSTLKFIERNWGLNPITGRSRDNLPDPTMGKNPYVPVNSPAIGDLFDIFKFGH